MLRRKLKWTPGSPWSIPLRYGLAVVSVAISLGAAIALAQFHIPQTFAAFALSAIAVTFWYGGTKPGILAALLSSVVRDFLFDPQISTETRLLFDLVFLVFALLMSQVVRGRNELQLSVADRTAELTRTNENLKREMSERSQAEYLTGQVFECSPDAVLIIGTDYRYKRVNPVHERNWGRSTGSMVGMHVAELVGEEFFEQRLRPSLDRCFAGETVRFEDWYDNALGHRFLAVSYSPLRFGSQQVEAVLAIGHDLTEFALASEALRQAQADLAHASRMTTMGELTASLAHEVNQPITAAVNGASTCVRWLTREDPDLTEAREAASGVIRNAKRAAEIINHIRAISKKGESKRQLADVNELIREIVALLRSETNRYSILVRTELDADLPNVIADPVLIQQVMMNLIMNGIDAMKEIERERELTICSTRAENGWLMVSVRDKGVGLDPLQMDRIFDAFFTTKPQGIGMGLRISRSIVESHGGRLWAASNSPHGAIFYFTLPVPMTAHLDGHDAEGAHTNV